MVFCLWTATFCRQDRALRAVMFLKPIVGGDGLPRAAGLFRIRAFRRRSAAFPPRGLRTAPRLPRTRPRRRPPPRAWRAPRSLGFLGEPAAAATCLRPRLALPAQLAAALPWSPPPRRRGPALPASHSPAVVPRGTSPSSSSPALALAWPVA